MFHVKLWANKLRLVIYSYGTFISPIGRPNVTNNKIFLIPIITDNAHSMTTNHFSPSCGIATTPFLATSGPLNDSYTVKTYTIGNPALRHVSINLAYFGRGDI